MNVIGAVGRRCRNGLGGNRRPLGLATGARPGVSLPELCVQFTFGLPPMRRVPAVGLTGFIPKLMGPTSDGLVAD